MGKVLLEPHATKTVALLLLLTMPIVGFAQPASLDSIAPPTLVGDECFRLPQGQMPIFFAPASHEIADEAMRERIAGIAAFWKEDGGPVLLTGYADPSETSLGRGAAVSADRLTAVRAALERAGIPGLAIWTKDAGTNMANAARDEAAIASNRSVKVALPVAGEKCWQSRRKLRAEWIARHCLPALSEYLLPTCKEILGILGR